MDCRQENVVWKFQTTFFHKILNKQRRTVIPTQAWVWSWVFQKNMKIAAIPSLQILARAGMTMSAFPTIVRSICPIRFILKITCFLNVPINFCRSSLPSHKQIYSGLNLNQDKATKPQTLQIVRQGEATPYWFKFNPLYYYLSNQSCIKQVVWNLFRRPVWLWTRC